MNVQIQSVKFDADRKLVEFVEHKMDKLDRFVERSADMDTANLYFGLAENKSAPVAGSAFDGNG